MSKLTRFSEVVGDNEEPMTPPVSDENDSVADRETDFRKKVASLERRLKALELRIGDLPSAPARTAEQFCSKISGRRTAAQLSESRKFAKRITQKGAR